MVRFKSMIDSGASLKRVAQLLAFANEKAQQQAQAASDHSQQVAAQVSQQTEQVKSQLSIQETGLKTQMQVEAEKQKAIGAILLEGVKLGSKPVDEALRLLGFIPPPPPQSQGMPLNMQQESQGSALQDAPVVDTGQPQEPSSFPAEGV